MSASPMRGLLAATIFMCVSLNYLPKPAFDRNLNLLTQSACMWGVCIF